MRKLLLSFLLGISISGISQSLGTNHFLEINPSHSCYIKAVEHLNLWQVTLSHFNKHATADTSFITPYLHPDTILKAMMIKLKAYKDTTLSGQDNYKVNINMVQSVLEKLQITFKHDINAGQLELKKNILIEKTTLRIIPKKQWNKLKDVSPFSANTSSATPLGKPIYKKGYRVYYKDELLKVAKTNSKTSEGKTEKQTLKNRFTINNPKLFDIVERNLTKQDTTYFITLRISRPLRTKDSIYKEGDTITMFSKTNFGSPKETMLGFTILSDTTKYTAYTDKIISRYTLPGDTNKLSTSPFLISYVSSHVFSGKKDLIKYWGWPHKISASYLSSQNQIINISDLPNDTTRLILYRHRKIIPISVHRKQGKKNLYFEKIERKYPAQIESADFFIKDGFIDNMSIMVKDDTNKLQFTNAFPIPLSSKKNIRMLNSTYLYANAPGGLSYKLCLGEIMKYYFAIEKDQYDLSPSDTLLKFEFKETKTVEIATLKKEDKNKIFEYRVFSDFIGLDETKPNGLVQIEAQRKFKLYTKYSFQRFPIGGFRYIEPTFRWNKIENQNSFLQPFATDTFSVDSVTQSGITKAQYHAKRNGFLTPLDLYQYQQISAGFNLNLISGYNGNTKLKYNIDGILNFGRTKLRDSIPEVDTSYAPYRVINSKQAPKELKVNTLQWGLAIKIQFFPEARYGFTIGAKYLNIYLANMDYRQKNKSYLNAYTDDTYLNRGIICSEIQIHKNFDNDSKFYIRYVFNSQLNNFKYNFSQFQVGYNAFLKF